jgi:uncharacterized repeat protein (TIGR03987 family)
MEHHSIYEKEPTMPVILLIAVIVTVLALIAYSIATWMVFKSGQKNKKQLAAYWIGFVFDLSGSIGMAIMAGGMHLNPHSIFGYSALLVMFALCIWLTCLPVSGNFSLFKKASLAAWLIWVGSFVSGMAQGMR